MFDFSSFVLQRTDENMTINTGWDKMKHWEGELTDVNINNKT